MYAHIVKSTNPEFASGGYKNVFLFAARADFLVLSPAVTPVVDPEDALTIAAAHTFTNPKGFTEWACRTHSVTFKSATVGEEGAQELEHTVEFEVIGDSASNQAQMQTILNDDIIALLKDADCVGGQYIQLGNDCVTPIFKVEFDGKTTKEGKKIYKVTATCKKKYWYSYAVTKHA